MSSTFRRGPDPKPSATIEQQLREQVATLTRHHAEVSAAFDELLTKHHAALAAIETLTTFVGKVREVSASGDVGANLDDALALIDGGAR